MLPFLRSQWRHQLAVFVDLVAEHRRPRYDCIGLHRTVFQTEYYHAQ